MRGIDRAGFLPRGLFCLFVLAWVVQGVGGCSLRKEPAPEISSPEGEAMEEKQSLPEPGTAAEPEVKPAPAVLYAEDVDVRVLPRSEAGKAVFRQGQAFMVAVDAPFAAIESVSARWDGQVISLFRDEESGGWRGIGGVGMGLEPGPYELLVSVATPGGGELTVRELFAVTRTEFSETKLTVDPRMVVIPKDIQKRVQQERRMFRSIWANPSPVIYWQGPFFRPTAGEVTSPFGQMRLFNNKVQSVHTGVDLAAANGEPIRAAAGGAVALVHDCYIEGGTVVLDHGGGLFTYYCHLSHFSVDEGELVEKGQVVGLAGSTGRVTGPHLHWGARVNGARVDGLSLLELEPEVQY